MIIIPKNNGAFSPWDCNNNRLVIIKPSTDKLNVCFFNDGINSNTIISNVNINKHSSGKKYCKLKKLLIYFIPKYDELL